MASESSKTRWRVVQARFEQSASEQRQCPEADVPEIAVAGRSNVGKSCLLNAVAGRGGLARVSRNPGRTRLLNFFRVEFRRAAEERAALRIVDLPGYGYAKAARSVRDTFGPMIEGYLAQRSTLRAILVLVDARRGPGPQDIEMLEWATAANMPSMLCVTKADKLGASSRGLLAKTISKQLDISPRQIWVTSAQEDLGIRDVGRGSSVVAQLAELTMIWSGADGREHSSREPG